MGVSANRLLEGIRVVDLGTGMAAAIAAKLLADMGAAVTRIEPEGGDPFTAMSPAYAVLRRGESTGSSAGLDALLADADACIVGGEDHPDLPERGDAAAIAAAHPRLVLLDIAGGPAGTVYAGPATELLAQVRSGIVWEQVPDRPIVNTFEPATYGAAFQGVIGLLGALMEREASGQGQVVSTSLVEGALMWIGTYWSRIENPTPAAAFVIPRGVTPLIFRTRDGRYIHMAIGGAGSKYGFYQALGIDDPTVQPGDSGMPQPGAGPRQFFGDCDLLEEYVAKWDADELLARIWERGLPAELVQEPGDCWDEPQVARNGLIVTDMDGTRHVGLPFTASAQGRSPARAVGQGSRPLEGLRVVDFGAFVAGPLAAVPLADLGAEVIKVEAIQGDPNRSIFKSFSVANRSKKVIGLDLKHPKAAEVVRRLCAGADVILNNFRPGVSARLGIDPPSLAAINPGAIVLEAPAFGNEGPLALKAGFDMVMQAWAGHETKAAGEGNEPRWNRTNLVDLAGAAIGSIAALAALLHRERTGESASLESPLCNAGIFTLSELIQHPDGSFAGVPRLGSSLSGYHPAESLYRARDGWIVVVARGDRCALALREALGLDKDLPDDPRAWAAEAEAVIAARIAAMEADEAIALLSPRGIWAEACVDGAEQRVFDDPLLKERGTVRVCLHDAFGKIVELGTMFALSRSPTGNTLPAPMPGAHTREVLASLGYEKAEIDALYDVKAVR